MHSKTIQHCADPNIAIWGLAYKQDTDSIKNSPSIALLEILKPFQVRVYDPWFQPRLPLIPVVMLRSPSMKRAMELTCWR